MRSWSQSKRWLSSLECHHLCLLAKHFSCQESCQIAKIIIKECIAHFLKPELPLALACGRYYCSIDCAEVFESSLHTVCKYYPDLYLGCQLASIAYSPCGTRVAAGSFDGHLILVDEDGGHYQSVNLLFADDHMRNSRYSRDSLCLKESYSIADSCLCSCCSLAYSPCGTRVAAAVRCAGLRVVDAQTGAILCSISSLGAVMSVAYSLPGTRVAAGCLNGCLYAVDPSTGDTSCPVELGGLVSSIAFSPCGKRLVAGCNPISRCEDGYLKLIDSGTCAILHSLKLIGEGSVNSISYYPCGKRVAVGCANGRLVLIDPSQTHAIGQQNDGPVYSVACSPCGKYVAIALEGGTLQMVNAETADGICFYDVGGGSIRSLAYAPC